MSVYQGIDYSKLNCTTKTYKGTGLGDGILFILNPTYYRCIVTDSNGNVFETEPCKVNFYKTPSTTPLTATLDRESLSVLSGIPFTITCEAEGGLAPYKYKWQIGSWFPLLGIVYTDAGCTTKTITDYYPGDKSAYYYRCTVTDVKGNVVETKSCKVEKFTLPPILP